MMNAPRALGLMATTVLLAGCTGDFDAEQADVIDCMGELVDRSDAKTDKQFQATPGHAEPFVGHETIVENLRLSMQGDPDEPVDMGAALTELMGIAYDPRYVHPTHPGMNWDPDYVWPVDLRDHAGSGDVADYYASLDQTENLWAEADLGDEAEWVFDAGNGVSIKMVITADACTSLVPGADGDTTHLLW